MPEPINPYLLEFSESTRIELIRLGVPHTERLVKNLEVDFSQYPHLKSLIELIPLINKSAFEIAKTFDQDDIDLILRLKESWIFICWSDFWFWKECSKEDITSTITGKNFQKILELFWGDSVLCDGQKMIPFIGFLKLIDISDEWVMRIENLSRAWMVLTFDDFSIIESLSEYHYSLLLKLFLEKIVQNNSNTYDSYVSIEKYQDMRIVDIVAFIWIKDMASLSTIFWWMYTLLDDFPGFRLHTSIKDSQSFFSSFSDYINNKFPIKDIKSWEIYPLIQRLFRIWDTRENIRQKSSNCFLVAWLCWLIRNPYFLCDLWEKLTISEGAWFNSKWRYTLNQDSTYIIDSEDIRSDHRVPSVIWCGDEELFAFGLWVKDQYDNWSRFFGINIPNWFWEVLRRYFTKDWKPKKSFISMVSKQIKESSGIFYTLWLEKERRSQSIHSIQWPIGYRILEATYNLHRRERLPETIIQLRWWLWRWAKELSNKWWQLVDVLQTFLSKMDWKIYTSNLWELWKIKLQHALRLLCTWQSIICMSIDIEQEDGNLYFDIEWFKMARNHAYSVKSFNESTWEIEVINPWDSSKSKIFTFDTFIEIFDEIVIALKK